MDASRNLRFYLHDPSLTVKILSDLDGRAVELAVNPFDKQLLI